MNPRPKISRGFPAGEPIAVVLALPPAAVQTDARPAVVAGPVDEPQVAGAACIDAPAAVAEAACRPQAADCAAAPAAELPAFPGYLNALPALGDPGGRRVND